MDIVERYEQLTKTAYFAGIPSNVYNVIAGEGAEDRLAREWFNLRHLYTPYNAWDSARRYVYGTMNPFHTKDTASYNLGKSIADFFLPKVYDPDDLGPYEEYSNYIKETEKAEILLREAEKLRRKARLEELKQEQEEKNKAHASKSRYF